MEDRFQVAVRIGLPTPRCSPLAGRTGWTAWLRPPAQSVSPVTRRHRAATREAAPGGRSSHRWRRTDTADPARQTARAAPARGGRIVPVVAGGRSALADPKTALVYL